MYIAMNRFRIAPGREEDFLEVWRNRDSHLDEVPEEAFRAWTKSDAFRKAHANAKAPEGIYLGPPKFEGYEVVL